MYQGSALDDQRRADIRRGKVLAVLFTLLGAAALGLVLVFTSCAHSATLRVSGTAPAFNNAGDCVSPVLQAGSDSVRVVVQVPALSLADSVTVARGKPFVFLFGPVPAGNYSVRAFASRVIGGSVFPGCDTIATVPAIVGPGRVAGLGQ
jgi:hypothetical protein